MSDKEKKFRFYVPLEIKKAKDKHGREIMKISGVASTMDRDSDGEVLDPNGFDFDTFLEKGFINWHHQTGEDPNSIIGEPIKAFVKDDKFHVEGVLYSWSKKAKDVYDLANKLTKSNSKRRLGWSIEGKAIEKDMLDERYVKKAKITGLAITPTPKNASTFLDVMKGERTGFENEEEFDTTIVKGEDGKEFEYIMDLSLGNGSKITVDKDFNINVSKPMKKALMAGSASGQAIAKESLEGKPKHQKTKTLPAVLGGRPSNMSKGEYAKSLVVVSESYRLGKITDDQMESIKLQLKNKGKI